MVTGKDEPQVNETVVNFETNATYYMALDLSIQITKPLPLYTILFYSHLLTIISIGMRINRNGTVKG